MTKKNNYNKGNRSKMIARILFQNKGCSEKNCCKRSAGKELQLRLQRF
jgi:hypothetical protein